ncbi:MAG: AAA family ATPase [Clostridiales bacterium]|nr:AAA family ATPase [Clostridiales bacterium]
MGEVEEVGEVEVELKRFIYPSMLEWKKERDMSVLEGSPRTTVLQLEGPRGSGKTYLAKKFATENYKYSLYLDMSTTEPQDVIDDFRANRLYGKNFCMRLLTKFAPDFIDSPDTLLIIDEIQDSAFLFNSIRDLMKFKFHVLIIGSYLGVTRRGNKYHYPSDDAFRIRITPLSFQEFLYNVGDYEKYMSLDLFGKSPCASYRELQKRYDEFMVIGGFPRAVLEFVKLERLRYKENHDMIIKENRDKFIVIHAEIVDTLTTECSKYLDDAEAKMFKTILSKLPEYIVNEKLGRTIDFTKFVSTEKDFDYNKVESVVFWMENNMVLCSANKAIECDITKLDYDARLYFIDVGMANYMYEMYCGAEESSNYAGALAENFVFLILDKKDHNISILHRKPVYGTYGKGEIDFLEYSKITYNTFAIDVKCGNGSSKTAIKLLSDRIVDYIVYARTTSSGGFGEPGMLTIPIYLIDRFDYGITDNPAVAKSFHRIKVEQMKKEIEEQKRQDELVFEEGYVENFSWVYNEDEDDDEDEDKT